MPDLRAQLSIGANDSSTGFWKLTNPLKKVLMTQSAQERKILCKQAVSSLIRNGS